MHLLYELSKNAWVRIGFGADFFKENLGRNGPTDASSLILA